MKLLFFILEMSTRWYPIYQRGNPQLRIFLPNFWMKLVKESKDIKTPPNHLKFIVSNQMTKYDVKQYLEKIYKIPVMTVNTKIYGGLTWQNNYAKLSKVPGKLYKDDDYKLAYVTLPKDFQFEFPDVTEKPESDKKQEKQAETEVNQAKKQFKKFSRGTRKGIPSFFGL